ncbi:hypothetical protein EsH8_XIV_000038 [Colletotrichum jinshuiense]
MQIAYYRGFYAHLSRASGGGMLAVGLSLQAASELCSQPDLAGRLVVAASNAPQSCTLSGDLDAVAEARQQPEREGVFARQLLVDTAYHSHHMVASADAYLQALLACNVTVTPPKPGARGRCVWNLSVRGDARLVRQGGEGDMAALKGPYWVANMVQMVKFSQALESAIWHGGPFDVAIELGPHPALKGPIEQTLKAAYGAAPLYASLLKRKTSDVAVVQAAIGTVWTQLGPAHVDFAGYRGIWSEVEPMSNQHSHELLGRRVPDDNDYELRWRTVLGLREIPWMHGHKVLREVLLPGAAYVSIAAQAAQYVAGARPVAQLAVEDMDILRPVVLPDNADGVETLFTVQVLPPSPEDEAAYFARSKAAQGVQVVRARFAYYVCPNEATGAMMHTCSGMLVNCLGPAGPGPVLPPREPVPDSAVHVDGEAIHDMFGRIGLDYQDAFSAMTECDRVLGYAAATAVSPADAASSLGPSRTSFVLHPVILDVAFQALYVAHTHPASLLLKTAMLPSHIDRVLIDPHVPVTATTTTTCIMDAWVTAATGATLNGDVEGLRTRAAGGLDASQDRHVFCRTAHGRDASAMGLALPPRDPVQDARTLRINEATERLTLWYIRRVVSEVPPPGKRDGLQWHHQRMPEAFEHHLETVRQGRHPLIRREWLEDGPEHLETLEREHGNTVEFRLMHAVGGALARVVQGEGHLLLQVMNQDDLLNRFYMQNNTSVATNRAIGQLIKQTAFKFPRCNMLEIGAGTGGTTWSVLDAINNLYDSYTFTDVSPGFFPAAGAKFSGIEHIAYRKLDVEQDIEPQDFVPHSYDVVIAANVLHAHDVDESLFATLPMPAERLQLLQQLFMAATGLLWVTGASASSLPRASIIRGITRVVPKEMPHLSVQVLGLEAGACPAADARHCAEALLRLRHMDDLRDGQCPLPLWAVEPECDVLADGEVRIQRVMPATMLNERFAARTRPIVRTTDATNVAVQAVVNATAKTELRLVVNQSLPHGEAAETVHIDLQYALHIPSHDWDPSVYLVCRRVEPGGDWAMALSYYNVSRLALRPEQLVRVHASRCTPVSIKATTDTLLRRVLIGRAAAHAATAVESGSAIILLLFEPEQILAERLEVEITAELQAANIGARVEICCVTLRTDVDKIPASWIRIHANLSRRMAKQRLPHRVDLFVDCSGAPELEHIRTCLPASCHKPSPSRLCLSLSADVSGEAMDVDMNNGDGDITITQAGSLHGVDAASLARQHYVCDWGHRQALPLTVQPPEANVDPRGLLRPDRTYIIMGGSGGLGLSITRWMIRQGARHIVLTSRRPRLDAELQAEAHRTGASVRMLAVDVTQQAQVAAAVATVRETMPPIAGVCNFSMVLHDSMFLNMDARQLNETLAAKVVGTEILDDVFGPGAEPLDFFIVTSSVATTIGNVAQANYHVANLFMDAVVARRRARGLPASIVHIGWVADTGYITRFAKEKQLADHFRSIRLSPLSETDVQDAFALAVRASRVGSGAGDPVLELEHDITMGLAPPNAPLQPGQATKGQRVRRRVRAAQEDHEHCPPGPGHQHRA